jgi:hypothetical protein
MRRFCLSRNSCCTELAPSSATHDKNGKAATAQISSVFSPSFLVDEVLERDDLGLTFDRHLGRAALVSSSSGATGRKSRSRIRTRSIFPGRIAKLIRKRHGILSVGRGRRGTTRRTGAEGPKNHPRAATDPLPHTRNRSRGWQRVGSSVSAKTFPHNAKGRLEAARIFLLRWICSLYARARPRHPRRSRRQRQTSGGERHRGVHS